MTAINLNGNPGESTAWESMKPATNRKQVFSKNRKDRKDSKCLLIINYSANQFRLLLGFSYFLKVFYGIFGF